MNPFEDLLLYDIDPESMTDVEKEIIFDEMFERGDYECLED